MIATIPSNPALQTVGQRVSQNFSEQKWAVVGLGSLAIATAVAAVAVGILVNPAGFALLALTAGLALADGKILTKPILITPPPGAGFQKVIAVANNAKNWVIQKAKDAVHYAKTHKLQMAMGLAVMGTAAYAAMHGMDKSDSNPPPKQNPAIQNSSLLPSWSGIAALGIANAIGALSSPGGISNVSNLSYFLPFLGMAVGSLTGGVAHFDQLSALEKSKDLGKAASLGMPILNAINSCKQFETKYAALAVPLLALGGRIALEYNINREKVVPKDERLKTATIKVLKEQAPALIAGLALGLGHGLYSHSLGLTTKSFDASGHLMMKMVASSLISRSVQKITERALFNRLPLQAVAANTLAGLYTMTDAVMLHNTVKYFHTIPEAIVGLLWGCGIHGIMNLAEGVFGKSARLADLSSVGSHSSSSSQAERYRQIDDRRKGEYQRKSPFVRKIQGLLGIWSFYTPHISETETSSRKWF